MPQPIDMQTELARFAAAEKIQDAAARASLLAMQRAQAEEEQERRIRETQVEETPETQSEHVDGDGKRKNPFAGRRKGADDQADEVSGEAGIKKRAAKVDDDHNFDVTV